MKEPTDNWWDSKGNQKKALPVQSTKINKSECCGIISAQNTKLKSNPLTTLPSLFPTPYFNIYVLMVL